MGVPGLASWIKQNFPDAIKNIADPHLDEVNFYEGKYIHSPFLVIDNVYIDLNAILHPSAQKEFEYGGGQMIISRKVGKTMIEKRLDTFNNVWNTIIENLEIVKPRSLVYIALDGPAPLSKMNQQRQRRFLSAKERPIENEDQFDSCTLTPGTIFMIELAKFLNTKIRIALSDKDSVLYGLQVIFSPTSVPGEGEHKLLKYIRQVRSDKPTSHCVIGPDGDLIMLTLATWLNDMYLFRKGMDHGVYELFNIGQVYKTLPTVVKMPGHPVREVTNDFILLGFFVGNDFLPKIQMFDLLKNGLKTMIDTYSHMLENHISSNENRIFLTVEDQIDHVAFSKFVSNLARKEAKELANQGRFGLQYNNQTLMKHITSKHLDPNRGPKGFFRDPKGNSLGSQNPSNPQPFIKYHIDYQGYRTDYYRKAGIDVSDKKTIEKMCISYIKTMAWIFEYYIRGLPDWRHTYGYHYAPLMGDLEFYMNSWNNETLDYIYNFSINEPILPFVQLLSVIPPTSFNLLPPEYGKLMTDPKSILVKSGMYDMDFQIDNEGKQQSHLNLVLVNFVDISLVEKAYNSIKTSLYFRNTFGSEYIFKYNKHFQVEYISDYGNISECHIVKRKLIL